MISLEYNMAKNSTVVGILKQIPELDRSYVHIKNLSKVETLVNLFRESGKEHLQVIADFDQTLTKSHVNGQKCASSFGVINFCKLLPESFCDEYGKVATEYMSKIMTGKGGLSEAKNIPHILDWFSAQVNLFVKFQVNRSFIPQMVKDSLCDFRDGYEIFVRTLNDHDVPLLVLSAGLGDIQQEIIHQKTTSLPNTRLVANFFLYDDQGYVTGVREQDIIHIFNKDIKVANVYNKEGGIKKRHNVIVLGDNIHDSNMADALPSHKNIIKIGFVNERVEERLDQYIETYDIVITEDQSLDIVNALINNILG